MIDSCGRRDDNPEGIRQRHGGASTRCIEVVVAQHGAAFKHAKKEVEAYLDCGLLCRGFRGFDAAHATKAGSSRSAARAAASAPLAWADGCASSSACYRPLRQWVLTFPFPWRPRLAHDGALLGALSRISSNGASRAAHPPSRDGDAFLDPRSILGRREAPSCYPADPADTLVTLW
jgi:hypothetical protein